MDKEPAVIVGAITAALTAGIGLAVAFGLNVDDDQRNAIIACVGPFVAVILLLVGIIRQMVYSPDSVQKLVDTAQQAGATSTPPPPVVP